MSMYIYIHIQRYIGWAKRFLCLNIWSRLKDCFRDGQGEFHIDAFVPACVGARPAQIWRALDLLFFLSSNYVMLVTKSHITYLLLAENMWNHAEIYANGANAKTKWLPWNCHERSWSCDLLEFKGLSSRRGSSAAMVKKPSHLVEWKTVCVTYHTNMAVKGTTHRAPCSFPSWLGRVADAVAVDAS